VVDEVRNPDSDGQVQSTPSQIKFARWLDTERAYGSRYRCNAAKGLFRGVCGGTPLFASDTKYEHGTGGPSFRQLLAPGNARQEDAPSFRMRRTEGLCAARDGHPGHICPDGPEPAGLRYRRNSVAPSFEPASCSPDCTAVFGYRATHPFAPAPFLDSGRGRSSIDLLLIIFRHKSDRRFRPTSGRSR
jgi:peptide-methionine (R)-S-oxide reductase